MATSGDTAAQPPRSARRIVVAGAGLAGLRTAGALREMGFRGEITVLGAEGLAPYDRPPLTKELFTKPEPVWLADELGSDLFRLADRVELATPARAITPVDLPEGRVRVDLVDGGEIVADVVVVATGSYAWRPDGWEGALCVHTAADAAALRDRLRPGTRLVCIGAGWIGAEVSGVAAEAGCRVTVLEAAAAPLATQLGSTVGSLTAPWYSGAGVDLHTGARVSSVHPERVHLADGRHIDADVILAAVGARPTTAWLGGALALTARGAVAVDRVGRADGSPAGFAPGTVYAVGDCADQVTDRDGYVPGGHWAGALHHPALVAADIMGGPLPASDPSPHTFSTQHGRHLSLFGQPSPDDQVVLRGDPSTPGSWTALYVEAPQAGSDDAVLVAGLAVDAPRDVGALRRLLGAPARPVIDLEVAADPKRALRDAVRPSAAQGRPTGGRP
jgi:NADPH-dependent 2,4-dienoyl-CoA reductase/sulfur reductase-like enzyme